MHVETVDLYLHCNCYVQAILNIYRIYISPNHNQINSYIFQNLSTASASAFYYNYKEISNRTINQPSSHFQISYIAYDLHLSPESENKDTNEQQQNKYVFITDPLLEKSHNTDSCSCLSNCHC